MRFWFAERVQRGCTRGKPEPSVARTNIKIRIWAPRRCAAAGLRTSSAKASVLPDRDAWRRGQAALRSSALCRPPWRGADVGCQHVNIPASTANSKNPRPN
jgi:hypothetical protein